MAVISQGTGHQAGELAAHLVVMAAANDVVVKQMVAMLLSLSLSSRYIHPSGN